MPLGMPHRYIYRNHLGWKKPATCSLQTATFTIFGKKENLKLKTGKTRISLLFTAFDVGYSGAPHIREAAAWFAFIVGVLFRSGELVCCRHSLFLGSNPSLCLLELKSLWSWIEKILKANLKALDGKNFGPFISLGKMTLLFFAIHAK